MPEMNVTMFVKPLSWTETLLSKIIAIFDYEMAVLFIMHRIKYRFSETGKWNSFI